MTRDTDQATLQMGPGAVAPGPPRRRLAVWALIVAMAATIGLVSSVTVPASGAAGVGPFPGWLLAGMFAAAEVFSFHIYFRRQTCSHSVSEIPLIIGLAFFSGPALLLSRLVGATVALAVYRRQPPAKLLFNLLLIWLQTVLAISVYALVLGTASPVEPRGWLAAVAAVGVQAVADALLIPLAISLSDGRPRGEVFAWVALGAGVASFANASIGLLAVVVLWYEPSATWLLVVVGGVLIVAYRAYASWRQKHQSLQRLYAITQVRSPVDVVTTAQALIAQTRELLSAEVGVLVLAGRGPDDAGVYVSCSGTGTDRGRAGNGRLLLDLAQRVAPTRAQVLRGRQLAAATVDGTAVWEVSDGIVATLRDDDGVVGAVLIGNRLGDVSSFDDDDAALLDTILNHVRVTLENSRLVGELQREVTDRRFEALHDSLTGLPNRLAFDRQIQAAIQQRRIGEQIAILLIDLDHFKEINDTLGHHTGDQLLVSVGEHLVDALASDHTVARLGGDEFAILLPGLSGQIEALALAEQVTVALRRPFELGALRLEVSGSIGIALCPGHGEDSSTLLRRADVAMYAAKAGRSGIECYAAERDLNSPRRLVLAAHLRSAIASGDLEVHFQPKAELSDGSIGSVEALARWQHPEFGSVPPDEFIQMAEHAGLIRELTRHVIRTSLRQWQDWRAEGLIVQIAVNLSTWSLLDLQLPDDIARLLVAHAVPSDQLRLEITESSMMADPHRTATVLGQLHAMGLSLSIDDFGTGYSSLTWLRRLPVDEIKIDRSFVSGLLTDDSDAAIVASIVDLGRNLGLRVVAEGIEDLATWNRLAALGCDAAQGYFLTRALPAPAFSEWLLGRQRVVGHGSTGMRSVGGDKS